MKVEGRLLELFEEALWSPQDDAQQLAGAQRTGRAGVLPAALEELSAPTPHTSELCRGAILPRDHMLSARIATVISY